MTRDSDGDDGGDADTIYDIAAAGNARDPQVCVSYVVSFRLSVYVVCSLCIILQFRLYFCSAHCDGVY